MKITAFITMLFFSSTCFAQVAIKAGQKVPQDGIFMTNEEAAKIISEREEEKKRLELELNFQKKELEIKCDSDLKISELNLDLEKEKSASILQLKNKEIENLYEQIEEDSGNYDIWWLAGGIVLGTVGSIAIFFAATQAEKMPYILAGN